MKRPEDEQQAALAEQGSGSSRTRALATVLASSLFLPVSCTGGYFAASAVTGVIADHSEQIPVDEAIPLRHAVAVIATSPEKVAWICWVSEPEADLAKCRLKHPGYSFLPASDSGYMPNSLTETSVSYRILQRESGKAVVRTHMHHYPMIFSYDVRATYEATDSDIRLISYKVGSDTVWGIVVGPLLAILLAIVGEILKRRLAKSSDDDPAANSSG